MKDRKQINFLSFSFIKQQKLGLLLLCTQSPAINHARNRKHSSKGRFILRKRRFRKLNRRFNFFFRRFSKAERAKGFLP